MLDIPPRGCINVHGSLLPRWRAAPIQWAVIAGDEKAGVTTMLMAEGLDTGDMLLTCETPVGARETAGELFDRLAQSGAELLTETLVRLDEITPRPQNDAESCYAHMLDKKMAVIDWSKSARELDCLVRGLNPWPIALTSLAGERLKIYAAEQTNGCGEPGTVLEADPKKGLTVACGEGALTLTEIQLVGGKRMKATDFLRGHAVEKGQQTGRVIPAIKGGFSMPYMGYYGIDMYYIVLVLPCVLFAFWAQSQVNGTFNRYSRVMSRRGLTGAQAAQAVLRANGVSGVNIEYVAGKLTDHFDPRTNTIRLSASVYQSTSVASIGVAAHEAGHAVQYAVGYSPIRLRNAIVPLTQVGATAAMPLILMGLVLNFGVLIKVGIIAFALSTVFQLVTLPVELDASHRALEAIGSARLLDEDEYGMAKKNADGGCDDLCGGACGIARAAAPTAAHFRRKKPR